MSIIEAIFLVVLQPIFWLGFLLVAGIHFKRVKSERSHYHVAINRDFYEGRHYLKNGILFSVIGSAILIAIGVVFPLYWVLIYEATAFLVILLELVWDVSLFFLLVTCLLPISIQAIRTLAPQLLSTQIDKIVPRDFNSASFMLLCTLFFLFRWLMIRRFSPEFLVPQVRQGKRGRKLVSYTWKEFSVVPLIVLVPGSFSQELVPFWPLITFNGKHYAFLVLPLVLSGFVRIWRSSIRTGAANESLQAFRLFSFCLCGFIVTVFLPQTAAVFFAVLVLLVILRFIQRYAKMKKKGKWYVETYDGVRVIAIQPNTPAAKMNLEPGDIILECNGKTIANENEFYMALKLVPTFCSLKVKTYEGELKLTESAVFTDSPHELGLILFH